MVCHIFESRVYYLCERCSREQTISEAAAMNF